MKIAVIGAGGAGGYFGGRLAQAGHDVRFVARGAHGSAIRHYGLMVKSIEGDFHVQPADVVDSIAEVGERDLVLLGVKAWQVKEVAQALKPLLQEDTMVMPLQNGVLAYSELAEVLGNRKPIKGLCKILSKIEAPGVINHFGYTPLLLFGEADNAKTERMSLLSGLFANARVRAKNPGDIDVELWKKFMYICSSGLLAVARTNYGGLQDSPELMKLLHALFREIHKLALKTGVQVDDDLPQRTFDFISSLPRDASASLTRDVLEGRPSEIEYQNGTVVKLGEQLGIETPVNRFITACINQMEKAVRTQNA